MRAVADIGTGATVSRRYPRRAARRACWKQIEKGPEGSDCTAPVKGQRPWVRKSFYRHFLVIGNVIIISQFVVSKILLYYTEEDFALLL